MQVNAIAYQKTSWATHRVAEISKDIFERILSNPTAANAGDYSYLINYATSKSATFTRNYCRTVGTSCSTAQIAADDIASAVFKAQTILPGGTVHITGTAAQGIEVTVMYVDKEFAIGGVLQTTPTCNAASAGIDWRNCCPSTALVPMGAGVRCRRFSMLAGGDVL